MDFKEFAKKAERQDTRNRFEACSKDLSFIPKTMQGFYSEYNPVDVEVSMDGNAVRFYPYSDSKELKQDYELEDDRFVFATCNSDPIFMYNDKIYTYCHECSVTDYELLAESFSDFLLQTD